MLDTNRHSTKTIQTSSIIKNIRLQRFSYMNQNIVPDDYFVDRIFFTVIDLKAYQGADTEIELSCITKESLNHDIMGYYFCDIENVNEWHKIFPNGMIFEAMVPSDAKVFKCSNKYVTDRMVISNPLHYNDWVQRYQISLGSQGSKGSLPNNQISKWYHLKYIEDQTKEICMQAIAYDYRALQYVKDPSKYPEILDHCIQINALSLRFIENPTYDQLVCAVKQNGLALQFVKEYQHDLCIIAIKQNPLALKYVKIQTDEICCLATKQNGLALQFVQEVYLTADLCSMAIKQNGRALQFVPKDKQTYELCQKAIDNCPMALQFVICMTDGLCKKAVLRDGIALKYCWPSLLTSELCLIAVKQNGLALKYISPSRQTKLICLEAVKQNGLALQYVYKKKKKICLAAVKQNGFALKFIKQHEQTSEIQKFAVLQNEKATVHVKKRPKFLDRIITF